MPCADLLDHWLGPLEFVGGCAAKVLPAHEVEDTVGLVLRAAGGAVVTATWNFAAPRKVEELEIEGTLGTLRTGVLTAFSEVRVEQPGGPDDALPVPRIRQVARRLRGKQKKEGRVPSLMRRDLEFEQLPWVHRPLIEAVVASLLEGAPCVCAGDAALCTSRLMDAAHFEYYGGRSDAFWKRPRTWRSLRAAALKATASAAYAISREELRFFRENGYLRPFSCESPEWRRIPVDGPEGLNLHQNDPTVFAVCAHASVVERVAQLLGSGGVSIFTSQIWAKPPRGSRRVPWHQDVGRRNGGFRADGSPVPTVTAWLALSPVTREAGAVRVVPGSHRRFFGEWRESIHADHEASGALGEADLDRAVALEARPGQFYLFHSWILHGSPPNGSSEPRVGLNMRFAGRGDEVDPGFEYVPLSGDVSDGGLTGGCFGNSSILGGHSSIVDSYH